MAKQFYGFYSSELRKNLGYHRSINEVGVASIVNLCYSTKEYSLEQAKEDAYKIHATYVGIVTLSW